MQPSVASTEELHLNRLTNHHIVNVTSSLEKCSITRADVYSFLEIVECFFLDVVHTRY
jgi:hypothetical protein